MEFGCGASVGVESLPRALALRALVLLAVALWLVALGLRAPPVIFISDILEFGWMEI